VYPLKDGMAPIFTAQESPCDSYGKSNFEKHCWGYDHLNCLLGAPAFRGDNNVMLINVQESPCTSGKPDFLGCLGPYHWYGDLKKWTNTASTLIRIELEKRGFEISDRNPRVLKLSIRHATIHQGMFQVRAIVYLTVETGDGYKQEFIGDNSSGWSLYRASSGAVTRAVGAMLSDKNIITYLINKPLDEFGVEDDF